jgi:hypothetical protein
MEINTNKLSSLWKLMLYNAITYQVRCLYVQWMHDSDLDKFYHLKMYFQQLIEGIVTVFSIRNHLHRWLITDNLSYCSSEDVQWWKKEKSYHVVSL